jgi:hypothetical protein
LRRLHGLEVEEVDGLLIGRDLRVEDARDRTTGVV